MTNGDMIKAMFPYATIHNNELLNYVHVVTDKTLKEQTFDLDWWNAPYKPKEKESVTVAKFHDFYPEDHTTWPPADKEILVKNHGGDNFIAYLEFDDGEDGGWGFYSEDSDFIADITEIDAWMPIPQHEKDKNYIPVWEREKKTISAETHEGEEEDCREDEWKEI